MYKRKMKLNSLYGQMVTKAMEICAEDARKCACAKCLHFGQCLKNGVPASQLGCLIARLALEVLPPINAELCGLCNNGLRLEAHSPSSTGKEKEAYVAVRAYTSRKPKKLLFSICLNGDETPEEIKILVFNAYARRKEKLK